MYSSASTGGRGSWNALAPASTGSEDPDRNTGGHWSPVSECRLVDQEQLAARPGQDLRILPPGPRVERHVSAPAFATASSVTDQLGGALHQCPPVARQYPASARRWARPFDRGSDPRRR